MDRQRRVDKETPYKSKPSRDFILPPANDLATDGPPTGKRHQTRRRPHFEGSGMTEAPFIFADWADVYRRRGYWPRPITPGTKACHVREWQKPDSELPEPTLASWLTSHANFGIGLLMGSPFPDGTTLGAVDIDRDEYVRVGRASLGHTPSGRVGKKGAVFFVRVRGRLSNPEFKVRGEEGKRHGKVAECLFVEKALRHPADDSPRHRRGLPLDREASPRNRIRRTADRGNGRCLTNNRQSRSASSVKSSPASSPRSCSPASHTHEPALRLVAQLVRHTEDDNLLQAIVAAALPETLLGQHA